MQLNARSLSHRWDIWLPSCCMSMSGIMLDTWDRCTSSSTSGGGFVFRKVDNLCLHGGIEPQFPLFVGVASPLMPDSSSCSKFSLRICLYQRLDWRGERKHFQDDKSIQPLHEVQIENSSSWKGLHHPHIPHTSVSSWAIQMYRHTRMHTLCWALALL